MTRKNYFLLTLSLAFIVYLPAFSTTFSFHNDGNLIMSAKGNWLGFPEAEHILLRGRALGALLVSVQSWFIHKISDLAFSRFALFVLLSWAALLMNSFLKRQCGLDNFWVALISFNFLLLPPNQLNVIWVANGFCGPGTIILSFGAYFLLDKLIVKNYFAPGWLSIKKIFILLLPAILFISSLFIYQPVAVIVFVFPFARILFSEFKRWTETRWLILRDIVFFSSCILLYRAIDQTLLMPVAKRLVSASAALATEGIYSQQIKFDLLTKKDLFLETLSYSFGGTFTLPDKIPYQLYLLLPFIFAIILMLYLRQKREKKISPLVPTNHLIQMVILGIVCYLLGNLPTFFAGGCTRVIGYRVMMPGMIMGSLVVFGFLRFLTDLSSLKIRPFIKGLAVVIVLTLTTITAWNIREVVRHNERQYSYLRSESLKMDTDKIRNIMIALNHQEDSFIEHPLLFEFNYSLATAHHIQPVIEEALLIRGEKISYLSVIAEGRSDILYIDNNSYLIDMSKIRNGKTGLPSIWRKGIINIYTKNQKKIITETSSPIWTFHEQTPSAIFPSWVIGQGEDSAIISIIYDGFSASWSAYNIYAMNYNTAGPTPSFFWVVQGSSDGRSWETLDLRQGQMSLNNPGELLPVTNKAPFSHYRIIFKKKNAEHILNIFAMRIVQENMN